MRISDWSSDVCSSDLPGRGPLSHCPVRADDSRDKKEMTMTTNSSPALQGSILVSGVGSLQGVGAAIARRFGRRSEEHTSELQSLMRISYAVFCLKKKKNLNTKKNTRRYIVQAT